METISIIAYAAAGSICGGHWLGAHWHEDRDGWKDDGFCFPTALAAVFWPIYLSALFWSWRSTPTNESPTRG